MLLGALPPPWEGMAVANKNVFDSKLIKTKFTLLHYDTKVNIKLATISRITIIKLFKTLWLYLNYPVYLVKCRPNMLYMPLSGSKKGILRDIPFILIAKIFGLKVILHYHASYYGRLFDKNSYFFKGVTRLTLGCVNRHIVLCEKLKSMLSAMNVLRDRIFVVENCLQDSSRISRVAAKEKDVFKILYLSNFIPSKGHFDVLESIPYLLKKIKNTKIDVQPLFIFVGTFKSDSDRTKFENFINTNKINSYVKTLGVLISQNKSKVLEESDVFVLPSYSEGQPFALIEAMYYGLPAIVTKVGCIEGMIKEGINGYFVPLKSPEVIADKIFTLIKSPDLARQMGENNRRLFEKKYTYERFESNMASVFQGVLGS